MHCFIEPQSFNVGIRQTAADKTVLLTRHLLRSIKRFKCNVASIAGGFDQRQQLMERETDPRNHHRPGFYAAHSINSFFQRESAGQVVMIERERFCHFATDRQRPGSVRRLPAFAAGSALSRPNS